MNAETLGALRVLIEKARDYRDDGPEGEGWQSPELSSAIAGMEEYLRSPPRCATCRWAEGRGPGGAKGYPLTLECHHFDDPNWRPESLAHSYESVVVAPSFGCVMWGAKDAAPEATP